MVVPNDEWEMVGRESHPVIDKANAVGVYLFGGGTDETVHLCLSRPTA